MPELPEVEVLVRHLHPALRGKSVCHVQVRRPKVILPDLSRPFQKRLTGARFESVTRRGKYLLFGFNSLARNEQFTLLGHLGMTGRMYLARSTDPLPKHAAVVLELDEGKFVYEDTRYFGRLTLDLSALQKLGPEPLNGDFATTNFARELKRSRQPIKVKLLDQSLIAGVGNIYASEALFRAGISPKVAANRLTSRQVRCLHANIRKVLREAIKCGSTIPLNFAGGKKSDGLFYFGRTDRAPDYYAERLLVYDRAGHPCPNCKYTIRRIVQASRSTFYCPHCQKT